MPSDRVYASTGWRRVAAGLEKGFILGCMPDWRERQRDSRSNPAWAVRQADIVRCWRSWVDVTGGSEVGHPGAVDATGGFGRLARYGTEERAWAEEEGGWSAVLSSELCVPTSWLHMAPGLKKERVLHYALLRPDIRHPPPPLRSIPQPIRRPYFAP